MAMASGKTYNHNGWRISSTGGFCTMKRFIASKGNLSHWAFLLRDCKHLCDERDAGREIPQLYLQPLYS